MKELSLVTSLRPADTRAGRVGAVAAMAMPPRPQPLAAKSVQALIVLVGLATALASPGLAQSQRFLLGPGSNVGPETKIEPKNCVTAADGSITCDTKIVNPQGDTPAKPIYSPFSH